MTGCAVGFADETQTAPCQQPVVTEIRARMPGQDWSPWLPSCRFHADAIQGSMDADCSCGACPAAVESRPIAGNPVGLACPGCGEPPMLLFGGGTQAFCGSDECPWFTWDPTKTLAELNASAQVIDMPADTTPPPDPDGDRG